MRSPTRRMTNHADDSAALDARIDTREENGIGLLHVTIEGERGAAIGEDVFDDDNPLFGIPTFRIGISHAPPRRRVDRLTVPVKADVDADVIAAETGAIEREIVVAALKRIADVDRVVDGVHHAAG